MEPIERPRQRRRVDGGGGVGDGPLGTDVQAGRGQQLGDVGGEQQIRRGHLAEAEVDQPHLAAVVEEDVRQPEVAVGDAVLAAARPTRRQIAASTSSVTSLGSSRSSDLPSILS